jgi:putative ABC transport system substrate-binding protein
MAQQPFRLLAFLVCAGVLLSGARLVASAQTQPLPVIGFLNIGSSSAFSAFLASFHRGLNSTGFAEGRNIQVEYRWADGNFKLLREQAVELVRRPVTLLVATGGLVVARAAKDATDRIPILFIGGGFPVDEGLVASLNRPGGNATGVNLYASALIPKRLELLHEMVPSTTKFGAILNPKTPSAHYEKSDLEKARHAFKSPLVVLEASTEDEIRSAFSSAAADGVGALVVSNDGFFTSRRALIIQLAANYRLPVIYGTREYVAAGGLISYGPSIIDAYRQIGEYTGRVLKGAKPSEMPVQQPTKFDLLINLKTAKSLGLDVPYPLLASASEVIE